MAELISVGVYGATFHLNMKNILQKSIAELLNLWTFISLFKITTRRRFQGRNPYIDGRIDQSKQTFSVISSLTL